MPCQCTSGGSVTKYNMILASFYVKSNFQREVPVSEMELSHETNTTFFLVVQISLQMNPTGDLFRPCDCSHKQCKYF